MYKLQTGIGNKILYFLKIKRFVKKKICYQQKFKENDIEQYFF